MKFLAELLGALFQSFMAEFFADQKEKRTEAKLEELGFDKGQLETARAEREIAKKAREIDNRPSGSVHDVLSRLRKHSAGNNSPQ